MKTEAQYRTELFQAPSRAVPGALMTEAGAVQAAALTEDVCYGLLGCIAAGDTVKAPASALLLAETYPDGNVPVQVDADGQAVSMDAAPDAPVRAKLTFALLMVTACTLPPFGNPRWDYFQYDNGALWGEVSSNDTLIALQASLIDIQNLTDGPALIQVAGVGLLRETALAALVLCLSGFHLNSPALLGKGRRIYLQARNLFLRPEGAACAVHGTQANLTPDSEGLALMGMLSVMLDDMEGESLVDACLMRNLTCVRHAAANGKMFVDGYQQHDTLADARAALLVARFRQMQGQDQLSRQIKRMPNFRKTHGANQRIPYRHDNSPHLSYAAAGLDSALSSDLLIVPPWCIKPLTEAP